MKLSELRGQGIADRACGFAGDLTLDRALQGNVSINNICAALRNTTLERADIVALLNAMAGSVARTWPRTPRGLTTHETTDVCEWLDNAADQIEEGVGLSDWVAK